MDPHRSPFYPCGVWVCLRTFQGMVLVPAGTIHARTAGSNNSKIIVLSTPLYRNAFARVVTDVWSQCSNRISTLGLVTLGLRHQHYSKEVWRTSKLIVSRTFQVITQFILSFHFISFSWYSHLTLIQYQYSHVFTTQYCILNNNNCISAVSYSTAKQKEVMQQYLCEPLGELERLGTYN